MRGIIASFMIRDDAGGDNATLNERQIDLARHEQLKGEDSVQADPRTSGWFARVLLRRCTHRRERPVDLRV